MRTMTAKFAGRCRLCGGDIPAGSTIRWEAGHGAMHADATVCEAARAARRATAPVVRDAAPIVAFINRAKEHIKFPKLRFLAPGGGELRLSVAGSTSKYPGSVQVKVDGAWVGRIQPDGVVAGPLRDNAPLLVELGVIASNPAAKAAAYGALMGHCSFCGLKLTDAGSVEVGYGPVCAAHYGLPHTPRGTPAVQEAA